MNRASFRTELSAITLDEGSNKSWIMALKRGTYSHPLFGEIVVDDARMSRFVENETKQVRGIQMDIDYDHKRRRDDAAGWVVQTEHRADGVWYLVEWTDEAAGKIRAREYKYFSSEFADQWTHPETGVTYDDVLFGGGLTNRPFIKGMVPVNLSETEADIVRELTEDNPAPTGGRGATEGDSMDPKVLAALRTALQLSEGTSEEDVLAGALTKLTEKPAPPAPAPADDLVKLAETNTAVAAMLAEREESARRLAAVESALTLSEVRRTLNDLDGGTELAITPAAKSLAEPLMLKLSEPLRADLTALLRQFAEGKGTVKLGGDTGQADPGQIASQGGDPVKQFTDLVDSVRAETGLSYRDAANVAMQRNGTLFAEYRKATDLLQGGGS